MTKMIKMTSIIKTSTALKATATSKRSALLMAILTTTLMIGSCKNIPPVTSGVGSAQIAPGQKFSKHLQVHNSELGNKLHISDIRSRTSNDLLEINLSLTSTYKKTLKLQYQFAWFDKDGFVIEAGKSPWQPVDLHGMQTATVPGLAPTAQVVSFSLYVREVPEKFFKF